MNRALPAIGAIALTVAAAGPAVATSAGHRATHVSAGSSVQAAVDATSAGGTVALGAGTFTGEVVIDHDLKLRGAGVGATTVKAPATLTSYGVHLPDGRRLTAIVRVVRGAHVRISDLTVAGPIPCGIEVSGIHALQGATLELTDARVTGIQADPTTCPSDDAAGRAVVYGTPPHIEVDGQNGSTAYGRVSHVQVDHFQHAGISVAGPADGPRSKVTVEHSVVTGGWQIPTFQAGLWLDVSSVVDVHDNRISGVVCGGDGCGPDPIFEGQGIGVLLLSLEPGTRVVGNDIDDNDVGITQVVSPSCCVITHNSLRHNRWFGIIVQDGDGSTRANTITGGRVGIGVVADFVDTTAHSRGDRIRGTTEAAVREIECCGVSATAIVTPPR